MRSPSEISFRTNLLEALLWHDDRARKIYTEQIAYSNKNNECLSVAQKVVSVDTECHHGCSADYRVRDDLDSICLDLHYQKI